MKLMIASDIHGSEYYTSKLIDRYEAEKPDRLLLLGDLLYHGPRNDLPKGYNPKAVISILNEIGDRLICVRGNCDTEVDQMVLNFPILADYSAVLVDDITMYLTHGHIYNEDNPMKLPHGAVVLMGHTHVPRAIVKNGIHYINPGSVSIPKENSSNAYIMYENRQFVFKNLDGEEYLTYRM